MHKAVTMSAARAAALAAVAAVVLAPAAQAYDPMPDPRLEREVIVPAPPPGSTSYGDFGSDFYDRNLKGRHRPRGEPQFGTTSRERDRSGGYGLGTRKATR